MKLGILFLNSGQLNQENFEFVDFPDFCEDATTIVWYLNVSFLNSLPTINICLKNYPQ